MDTKLKRTKKPLFITAFMMCVCSFLTFIVCMVGATTLNSFSGYIDSPYFPGGEAYSDYQEFLQGQDSAFFDRLEVMESQMRVWAIIAIAAAVLALITLIYLVVVIGDRDENGKIRLNRFDHTFAEIQLAGICIIGFVGGTYFVRYMQAIMNTIYDMGARSFSNINFPIYMVIAIILGVSVAALGLGLILSCVKKVKAGEFIQRSACGWLISKIYTEIYMGGSTMRKVVIIAVLICLISATIFMAPVMLIIILVFAPRWVRKYDEIKKGISEVSGGNLDYKIPVEGDSELDQLADGINEISRATSVAVQNEVKNQRMKTDLISNVSHDLKTPLTSMVTYIDLLKTEGMDSKNAPEYLQVLEQKTEQLRQLTEDLFEAAKASSGAIPVRLNRVDLLSLLNQGLGELNQKIEEAQLDFIINAQKDHYFVTADGQLLWRVTSNLLGNALKYSQENTRVYVTFQQESDDQGGRVFMEMKNISKQSLNINPTELMDRFKRGDEARSTEGSGLGLAIAKDLIKLMNGQIELSIDGDLFKARIMLPAALEDEPIVAPIEKEPKGETGAESEENLETEEEIKE